MNPAGTLEKPVSTDSAGSWRIIFLVIESMFFAQLAACIHAITGPRGGWDPLFAAKPGPVVSLFWLVYTVAELFLLFASPFFFKRLGGVARIGFALAVLGVLLGFLWLD